MEENKINWGILGCSDIAKTATIPAILQAENATLYAVSSRSKNKAKEYSTLFHPEKVYDSYQEMLKDPNIDAVYISLPNSLHKDWSILAMKAGKNVLCEKPMAEKSGDVIEMQTVSIANNVLLMEAFMYRFNPKTIKVKELIDNGIIGDMKNIYANFSFFEPISDKVIFNKELAGGCTYDVGCYCVNIIRYLTGEEPFRVFAASAFLDNGKGVDIDSVAILEFKSGIKGMIASGFNRFLTNKYEVTGTSGRIEVPCAFLPEEENRIIVEKQGVIEEIKMKSKNQYTLEIEHFNDCILKGRRPGISHNDTFHNVKVLESILQSSMEKKAVYL